jgi:Protein of unknown function (DUF4239)
MGWLVGIPVLLTLPIFAVAAAALAVTAQWIVGRHVPVETLREQHDFVAALLSVVGVLYSVVLGFLVGTVWTSFDAAQQNADQEARFVATAYSDAGDLPEPQRTRVQTLLKKYALDVRDREWEMLSHGSTDPSAAALLTDSVQTVLAMPPPANATPAEALRAETIAASTVQNLRKASENRIVRIMAARDRLPSVIFEALVLGGVMVVAYVLFFGSKRIWIKLTTTALLAGSIGLFFGLIVDLNSPYAGPIRVSPEIWTAVIDAMQ